MQKLFTRSALVSLASLPLLSHAAADVSDITAAATDAAAYIAAITGVMVAIWAGKLVYRKFFGG